MARFNEKTESGPVEFPRYPIPLNLYVDNYIFSPYDLDSFQAPVDYFQSLLNPLNSYYGRGFIQIVVADVVKREIIYDTKQIHLALMKYMVGDLLGSRGPGTGGIAMAGYNKVTITVCREYLANHTQTPPTRIVTVKPDEGV